jgi:hypothetical protein
MATSKATTTSIEDAVKIARVFPGEENWCKEYIAAHLLSRTWIQVQLADAVGKMDSEDLTGEIDHYTWFSDLLPAVNWWQDLADNCLHGPDGDGSGGGEPQACETRRESLVIIERCFNRICESSPGVASVHR